MAVVHKFKSRLSTDWEGKSYWVRMHVVPTSGAVEDAVEEWVDQMMHRQMEWYSYGGGFQQLAENIASGLGPEDRECFIGELKARKAGLDYSAIRES